MGPKTLGKDVMEGLDRPGIDHDNGLRFPERRMT